MVGRRTPVPIDELRAVLAHVRALDVRTQRRTARTQVAAYAAFVVILAGSLRAAAPHAYLSSSPQPNEESRMRILQNLGVVSSIALTASVATAQNALQWRVEDGGNGHWYELVVAGSPVTWGVADEQARLRGGLLACITSPAENAFVLSIDASNPAWRDLGPWLGGFQATNSVEPAGGWNWVSGETWDWAEWTALPVGEPNNAGCGPGNEDRLHFVACGSASPHWNDIPTSGGTNCCGGSLAISSYIVEWSSDCNNDGEVDYGQIRAGALADSDSDGVPDCCEFNLPCPPCAADVDLSGGVNGVDLAAVLNNWGTSGGKQARSDINKDGIVDGADLAEVLNSWGTCP